MQAWTLPSMTFWAIWISLIKEFINVIIMSCPNVTNEVNGPSVMKWSPISIYCYYSACMVLFTHILFPNLTLISHCSYNSYSSHYRYNLLPNESTIATTLYLIPYPLSLIPCILYLIFHYIALCCVVLYWMVLCCTALYCIALHCVV